MPSRQCRCWPTSHASARNAETGTWLKGRCKYNKRLDEGMPALPGSLIRCTTCGRSTCLQCLDELQREGLRVVLEMKNKGLTMQHFPAFERLLAGDHRTAPPPSSGAAIAATIQECVWCRDTCEPNVVGVKEPVASRGVQTSLLRGGEGRVRTKFQPDFSSTAV